MSKEFNRIIKYIITLIWKYRNSFALLVLLTLAFSTANLFLPIISTKIIDNGLLEKNWNILFGYSVLFLCINILVGGLRITFESKRLKVFYSIRTNLHIKVIEKLNVINIGFFNRANVVEIYQQISKDIEIISNIAGEEAFNAVVSIILGMGYLCVFGTMDLRLALLMLGFIPLRYLLVMLLYKFNIQSVSELNEKNKDYSGRFNDYISGMKYVRLYGIFAQRKREFENYQSEISEWGYKQGVNLSVNIEGNQILVSFITTLVYIIAGRLILNDTLTIGELMAFLVYSVSALDVISDMMNLVYGMSVLQPSVKRFLEFMEEEEEMDQGCVCEVNQYTLRVENLKFHYAENKEIFNNVSIEIPEKTKVVIWGENGAGKTTLINLLLRLYLPVEGAIYIGKNNINDISLKVYRSLFSYVGQNIYLFNDTIKNNICLYQSIDEEVLLEVIEIVGLKKLILEKTLNYVVGNNGALLSGGQRQRIALARALLKKCQIIVLDEADANLDAAFENKFWDIIQTKLKDKTVLCITHKKEILDNFDVKYKIEDGILKKLIK